MNVKLLKLNVKLESFVSLFDSSVQTFNEKMRIFLFQLLKAPIVLKILQYRIMLP